MNTYLLLLGELALCLAISLAVLRVLSRPLAGVLDRLCPDERAAAFWHAYTRVMLLVAPPVCVLVVDLLSFFGDPFDKLRFALLATLCGLLGGLHTVGQRLGRFVRTPGDERSAP